MDENQVLFPFTEIPGLCPWCDCFLGYKSEVDVFRGDVAVIIKCTVSLV